MLYRSLGRSSLQVSEIGFGCMSLEEDQHKATLLLHQAIDVGINFFDTADLYQKGANETMLGKALKGKRDKVILATKAGNQWRNDGSGWDWNASKAYIMNAAENSLIRLQTDHIDLFQLHGGTLEDPIDETIEAFEQLQREGKILHYGISSIRPAVIREYIRRSSIVSVMMQYSLLDRRPEEECLALLRQNNIGVLARGALAKGLLAGKAATDYLNYAKDDVAQAADAINAIADDKRTRGQTAIRFVLQNQAISSVIAGMRTMEQLGDAAGAISSPPLTAGEIGALQQSLPSNKYEDHR